MRYRARISNPPGGGAAAPTGPTSEVPSSFPFAPAAEALPDDSDAGGFVASGDNFRTVGPWQLFSGSGWRRWQEEAATAELRASRLLGDAITEARQRRDRKARRAAAASAPLREAE